MLVRITLMKRLPVGRWVFACLLLLLLAGWPPSSAAGADTLLTKEGRLMTGTASLDTRDRLLFVSPEGGQRLFKVTDISRLVRDVPPAQPKLMVHFTDGTRLAAEQVEGRDGSLILKLRDRPDVTVPLAAIAAIDISPSGLASPASERGVLLAGGDFLPGDVVIQGDLAVIESAIFGKQKLKLDAGQVRRLVLGRQRTVAGPWLVTTADNSVLSGESLGTDAGTLVVKGGRLGEVRLPASALATISYLPAAAASLAGVAPAEVVPLSEDVPAGPGILNDATFGGVPPTLREVPVLRAMSLRGGTAVTWTLDARQDASFACMAGVPSGLVPTGGAVLVLLADGREVARTPLLRSTSRPVPTGCDLTGVKQLTLKVESSENLPGTEVLLADPLLLPAQ